MVKRILLMWLITCTLGYGSVWAFDGHADETAEHHMVVGDAGQIPDTDKDHPACDHCCHASAHIIALCPASVGAFHAVTGTGFTPYQQRVFFRSTAPPDRPPRS